MYSFLSCQKKLRGRNFSGFNHLIFFSIFHLQGRIVLEGTARFYQELIEAPVFKISSQSYCTTWKVFKKYSKVFKKYSKSIQKVFKKYSKSIQKVLKHRKNCEYCPGHSLTVTVTNPQCHDLSFSNFPGIVNCVTNLLNCSQSKSKSMSL